MVGQWWWMVGWSFSCVVAIVVNMTYHPSITNHQYQPIDPCLRSPVFPFFGNMSYQMGPQKPVRSREKELHLQGRNNHRYSCIRSFYIAKFVRFYHPFGDDFNHHHIRVLLILMIIHLCLPCLRGQL